VRVGCGEQCARDGGREAWLDRADDIVDYGRRVLLVLLVGVRGPDHLEVRRGYRRVLDLRDGCAVRWSGRLWGAFGGTISEFCCGASRR